MKWRVSAVVTSAVAVAGLFFLVVLASANPAAPGADLEDRAEAVDERRGAVQGAGLGAGGLVFTAGLGVAAVAPIAGILVHRHQEAGFREGRR